jgi:hypothetical protein
MMRHFTCRHIERRAFAFAYANKTPQSSMWRLINTNITKVGSVHVKPTTKLLRKPIAFIKSPKLDVME